MTTYLYLFTVHCLPTRYCLTAYFITARQFASEVTQHCRTPSQKTLCSTLYTLIGRTLQLVFPRASIRLLTSQQHVDDLIVCQQQEEEDEGENQRGWQLLRYLS